MLKWTIEARELDLKFTWKISRGSTNKKTNYFITVADGTHQAMGEVAGITQSEAQSKMIIDEFKDINLQNIETSQDIYDLKLSAPLSFAMESALTHLLCQKKNLQLSEYFKLTRPKKIPTSFSLPILPIEDIPTFIEKNNVNNFPVCKIKVGHKKQKESCLEVARHYSGPLRVDANEAFENADQVLQFLDSISSLDLQFLEQPLPAHKVDEYIKLKKQSPLPILADESLQTQDIDQKIVDQFHGINVKLMKSGGYGRAVRQIQQAKDLGLKVMLGCMVETSMAIYGAFCLGQNVDWFDLDGFLFFKNEPFQMIVEKEGYLYPAE